MEVVEDVRVNAQNPAPGALAGYTNEGGADLVTSYGYDVLDNLTTVTQAGGKGRSFTYDSMGRLATADNPESGVTSYAYKDAGDLVKKTDARGKTTCFGVLSGASCDGSGYDALGRVVRKSYSDDANATVTFVYDTGQAIAGHESESNYPLGRLVSVGNALSTTTYRYDAMGRVAASKQATGGNYVFGYAYNEAGGLKQVTYPSGRVVTYTHDAAGRPIGAVGNKGTVATTYAADVTYGAHGGLTSMFLGKKLVGGQQQGLVVGTSYNTRMQTERITATRKPDNATMLDLWLAYCVDSQGNRVASCGSNNGNVLRQDVGTGGTTFVQSYAYDALNRLTVAAEADRNPQGNLLGWREENGYDRFGNRWVAARQGLPALTADVPQAPGAVATENGSVTNRLSTVSYDAAGNVSGIGVHALEYDAENRLLSWDGATKAYAYDGEGRRVKMTTPGGTTVYVYDAAGQLAAEYMMSGQAPQAPCTTCYLATDHLGSTRLITDADGTVKQRIDYLPFGEEITGAVNGRSGIAGYAADARVEQKFTGKERDAGTGLDYFLARYYSSAQGRFTSPDEFQGGIVDPFTGRQVGRPGPLPYADITDPQTLNKYAYVRNNPLRYIDPDGHAIETVADIAFITYDLNQIRKEGFTAENAIGLGGDVLGAAVPFATGVGAAAKGGYRLAKSGEALEHAAQAFTGLQKNWNRILEGLAQGANYRVPDLLSEAAKFIGEVKNTTTLGLTKQLNDLFTYAKESKQQLGLFLNDRTQLSKPLLQQIRSSGARVYRYTDKKWNDVTDETLKALNK